MNEEFYRQVEKLYEQMELDFLSKKEEVEEGLEEGLADLKRPTGLKYRDTFTLLISTRGPAHKGTYTQFRQGIIADVKQIHPDINPHTIAASYNTALKRVRAAGVVVPVCKGKSRAKHAKA